MYLPNGLTDEQKAYFAMLDESIEFFTRELWLAIGSENKDGTGKAPLSDLEIDLVRNATDTSHVVKVILGTRGLGKTYLVAASNVVWRLFRDPTRKIVLVCKNEATAVKTSTLIKGWLETVWFLQHLKPRPGRRDNVKFFDVGPSSIDRQASVSAVGIGGTLENNRAHTVIVDDVETIANTITFEARERLFSQCSEFVNWLYPSIPHEQGGARDANEIVYTLTPKHEETIAGKLEKEGHPVFAYPLCVPASDEQTFPLAPAVVRRIAEGKHRDDGCLFEKRFSREDVALRRMRRHNWLKECQLVRTLGDADRYPLKLSNFIVYDIAGDEAPVSITWGTRDHNGATVLPDIPCVGIGQDRFYRPIHVSQTAFAPFVGTKMYIDPAGTGKDKTGYAVVSHLNGFYWVRALGGLEKGATEENLNRLARTAFDYKVSEITVEKNFGGDAYRAALEIYVSRLLCRPGQRDDRPTGWQCMVKAEAVTSAQGHKEARIIDVIEPLLSMHRIVIPTGVAANTEFQGQASRLTRERGCLEHDDLIDALAGCLNSWGYTYAGAPKEATFLDTPAGKAWQERMARRNTKPVYWFRVEQPNETL